MSSLKWRNLKKWEEIRGALEDIEWDTQDHYSGSPMVLDSLIDFINERIHLTKIECLEIAKDVQQESWSFKPKFNVPINECVLRLQKLTQLQ